MISRRLLCFLIAFALAGCGGSVTPGSNLANLSDAGRHAPASANFTYYAITFCCSLVTGIANGPDTNVWMTGLVDANNYPHDAITVMVTSGSGIGSYHQYDTPQFVSGGTYTSVGITSDGTNLWFAANGTSLSAGAYIAQVSTNGTFGTSYALPANSYSNAIATGPGNSVWFAGGNTSNGAIVGTIRRGKIVTYSTKTGFAYNKDITLGPDGNMWYLSGTAPYVVGRVTPKGRITKFKLPTSYTKNFSGESHLVSANGALWVTLPGISAIAQVTTTGSMTLYAQAAGAQSGPAWAAVSGNTIYFADLGFTIKGKTVNQNTLETFDTTSNTYGPILQLVDPTFGAPGPRQPLTINGGHVWFGSADSANNTSGLGDY